MGRRELLYELAFRQREAADMLFGNRRNPNCQVAAGSVDVLRQLGFGDGAHPSCYADAMADAYYTLRYEYGYAFEYACLYGLVIRDRHASGDGPIGVLSLGCGQRIDLWGLRYAEAGKDVPSGLWRGIDLETWPRICCPDDPMAWHESGVDVAEFLAPRGGDTSDVMPYDVLMLPKVLSELSADAFGVLEEWLARVRFVRPAHYLCIVHTDRQSLVDKGDPTRQTLDARRGARVARLFSMALEKQGYELDESWVPEACAGIGLERRVFEAEGTRAPFLCFDANVAIGAADSAFRNPRDCWRASGALRAMGALCADYVSGEGAGRQRFACHNDACAGSVGRDKSCPLYKGPRTMTGRMAWQLVKYIRKEER